MRVINLSHPISPDTPVMPLQPPVEVTVIDSTEEQLPGGSGTYNTAQLTISLHTGTHLSAPFRFLHGHLTIDQVPLDRCFGPAYIMRHPITTPLQPITAEDILPHKARLQARTVLLIHTGWSRHWGEDTYFTQHPFLTLEATELLLEWGIHLIGVDFPSIDHDPFAATLCLLNQNVLVVQNLTNIEIVIADHVDFLAIPLQIQDREGSPVRAIAIDP